MNTKSSFLKEFKTGNYVKKFGDIIIRHRMWDSRPWQIVDIQDFDDCKIINSFYLREELWDFIRK